MKLKMVKSWDDFCIEGIDGEEIIFQDGPYGTPTIKKQDADFIVRACNAHDELIAALTNLIKCPDLTLENLERETIEAINQARKILAKAKGEI